MESRGAIEGEDKFLGYQWKGELEIGPAGPDNKFQGGRGYEIFERRNHWYLIEGDRRPVPVAVDDLQSDAPPCPKMDK